MKKLLLKTFLWTVTLILLFYAEEDWRGARAWAATKAKWEAKGESFDYSKFIPPPVPDAQNLGAISLFKVETRPIDSPYDSGLHLFALDRALQADSPGHDLQLLRMGNWQKGELSNDEAIRKNLAILYGEASKGLQPPRDPVSQLDALYPFLAALRSASVTRPSFRFQYDYAAAALNAPPVGLINPQLTVCRILMLHAFLELDDHQSGPALADVETGCKLIRGVMNTPSYVGGLTAIAMSQSILQIIYDGLAGHAWDDSQLAGIEAECDRVDFLSDYHAGLRSQVAGISLYLEFLRKSRPPYPAAGLHAMREVLGSVPLSMRSYGWWPTGWLDQNEASRATFILGNLNSIDPKARRVFPEKAEEFRRQKQRADQRVDAWAPWNVLFTISNSDWTRIADVFAQAQVWLDETRIACALERYRLAHHAYPASLDLLVPDDIPQLPHDILNGQPYHYWLRPNGTFLLYSVGWNQKDDGGKVVYQKDSPTRIDPDQGDWVWPTPQAQPTK